MTPVLLLGADGFIGRHIAFYLRQLDVDLLVSARRVSALDAMGFSTLQADLTDPRTHNPDFWKPHLAGGRAVINAAGLLNGSASAFEAVHRLAPSAAYAAQDIGAKGVLISAVGIDDAQTPFAHWRREAEAVAKAHKVVILRPGLVMGDTSYGGTSLARGLAAMPWRIPVVGDGKQPSNPIHAEDLARAILAAQGADLPEIPHEIGGPETVSQADLLARLRGWLGVAPVPVLRIPRTIAMALGRMGDMMRLGPISATAVAQLDAGLIANTSHALSQIIPPPRPFSQFLNTRPAGTQDLWHARSYLLRPVLRLTLALLWIVSGILGLTLSPQTFLPLTPGGPDGLWVALARAGGLADLAIALALIRNWKPQVLAAIQGLMVAGYTFVFTVINPNLWALPLGGLLKNLPILALIAIWAVLERER